MREINGNSSKTLPDPGNSSIYNLEPAGHQFTIAEYFA